MGKIVAIGGVTPPSTLDLIDKEIIKLTDKKSPKVLYIPTAGGDKLAQCEFFKGIYEGRLGCRVDILFLIRETPTEDEIKEKIFSSDILYIEGGSISKLMHYFKKFNMEKILEAAYEQGIVLAGKSAGALCWGQCYFENHDTEGPENNKYNNYMDVVCMKFLDFIICPHYNLEGYNCKMEEMIKAHNLIGIGLDNNCAMIVENDNYRIIATHENANAYKVFANGTGINKEIISKHSNYRNLNELLQIF